MQHAGRGSRLAGLYAKGSEKSGKPGRGPLASTVGGRGRHGEGGQRRRQHCCRRASPWRCESMPRVAGCGAPRQGRTTGLVPRGSRRRVWSRKRKWSGRAPVVTTGGRALRGGEDVVAPSRSHFCPLCSPRVVRMVTAALFEGYVLFPREVKARAVQCRNKHMCEDGRVSASVSPVRERVLQPLGNDVKAARPVLERGENARGNAYFSHMCATLGNGFN